MTTAPEPALAGCYINLDESAGREAAMQAHLQALGLASLYPRFAAVRGRDLPERDQTPLPAGHLGCWFSHRALWERAAGLPDGSALHILEDDARLHPLCRPLLVDLCRNNADWDLLYSDVFWHPPPTPEQFALILRATHGYHTTRNLTVMPLKGWRFTGTSSYVVRPRAASRLLQLLQGRWREGRTVDVLIDELVQQGALRALVVLPFLSTLGDDHAESTTGAEGPAVQVIGGLRRALFAAADQDAIRRQALGARSDPGIEPLLDLYLALIRETFRNMRVGQDRA